jgi:phage shock protein A
MARSWLTDSAESAQMDGIGKIFRVWGATMALTVTELADEVRETNRRLTDAIQGLRTEVAELRKEAATTNNSLNWMVRIGASLLACMLGILGYAYRVDQKATRTEEAVIALQANVTEFKADFKARDKQIADSLAALQKDSRQIIDSLARIEKSRPTP